jgi:hypothetical protein
MSMSRLRCPTKGENHKMKDVLIILGLFFATIGILIILERYNQIRKRNNEASKRFLQWLEDERKEVKDE